jgi:outer membrane protein assembly factor BamB
MEVDVYRTSAVLAAVLCTGCNIHGPAGLGAGELLGWPEWTTILGMAAYDDDRPVPEIELHFNDYTRETFVNMRPNGIVDGGFDSLVVFDEYTIGPPILDAQSSFTVMGPWGMRRYLRYDGELLWENLEHPLDSNGALGPDGTVYATGVELVAVASDGTTLWTAELPVDPRTNVIHDGVSTVLVGGWAWDDGVLTSRLWAFDDGSGELLWEAVRGDVSLQMLSIGEDAVYGLYGHDDGYDLVAHDRDDGAGLWTLADAPGAPVVGEEGELYASGQQGVVAITADGTVQWTMEAWAPCTSALSLGRNGHLYLACSTEAWSGSDTVQPVAVSARDGEVSWMASDEEGADPMTWTLGYNEPSPILHRGKSFFVTGWPSAPGNHRVGFADGPGLAHTPWPSQQGDAFGRSRMGGAAFGVDNEEAR